VLAATLRTHSFVQPTAAFLQGRAAAGLPPLGLMNSPLLFPASATASRCWWCGVDPQYVEYHDTEWGVPSHDNRYLFEKIVLEGFQAGLSWLTILRKRQRFREVFANFEVDRLAKFGPREVERLVLDAGIVRHRGKIESAINNAKRCRELVAERGSLEAFLWSFAPAEPPPLIRSQAEIRPESPESKALSKELRRRGWSFVGPTTMYAMMQAVGIVNDHVEGCAWRARAGTRRR